MNPTTAPFIDEDFLLSNGQARELYGRVKDLPIIDYHNHLPPGEIASDRQFENITQVWLAGDHYKWRAMRANGVDETYITGEADDYDKFLKWAETVPYTLRNPLHHWTHLELKRYFDVDELLCPGNAHDVYEHCTCVLAKKSHATRGLLRMMNVRLVGTTDDPTDSLEHHEQLAGADTGFSVVPSFRPDKAVVIDKNWLTYLDRLGNPGNYTELLDTLESRIAYFHERGCRVSDHGLEQLFDETCTAKEAEAIFKKAKRGEEQPSVKEKRAFQTAVLTELGRMYHERGWVQQFHLGAIRDNNGRLLRELGNDVGVDSIGDFSSARGLSRLLNGLDETDQLARTIVYNLNPADNAVFATMMGNFGDGRIPGKMQFGSGWWYNDQLDGMREQMNVLSNMGLISRFVGMLTDSRSFLSFPRHEYFRRLLCDLFGRDMEGGLIPNDIEWTGKICADISYNNARNYFDFKL